MLRKLFVIIMVANLYLAVSNIVAGNGVKAAVCGGAFLLMFAGAVAQTLGAHAKRGDRIEPDREAGK